MLIVDHDPTFLQNAGQLLGPARNIFFARNAEQAKTLIGSVGENFSVVLVDLDLPDQDGFSFIIQLRQNFPDLPVIAMGGTLQQHEVESAKAVGAVDALSKPITPEWRDAIMRAISRAKATG